MTLHFSFFLELCIFTQELKRPPALVTSLHRLTGQAALIPVPAQTPTHSAGDAANEIPQL